MTFDKFKFELVSIVAAIMEKAPNQRIEMFCTDNNNKYPIVSVGGKTGSPEIHIGVKTT